MYMAEKNKTFSCSKFETIEKKIENIFQIIKIDVKILMGIYIQITFYLKLNTNFDLTLCF